MAILLAELLHDASRRAGEVAEELLRLKSTIPPDLETYRGEMEVRARRAKQLAETILADPDIAHPLLSINYFRDFRDIARLIQALENFPLLVLRRFSDPDMLLTRLVREICKEVRYPYPPPICSSLSSQYYWTVADMDLIFVPSLEPERLLGLADLYHELGHIILFREERRLVIPGTAIADRHFDRLIHDGRRAGWPAASLREVQQFRHLWRTTWFLEFGADLIATYLVGPAFGWCNIRTSTNIGGELFRGNESHPADDARSTAMGLMLDRMGESASAGEIRSRWTELVALSGESQPPRYDTAYPPLLLQELCDLVFTVCRDLGLSSWTAGSASSQVGPALHDAWTEFRTRPETFAGYERQTLAQLAAKI
jgi:hypothetical protein